MIIYAVSTNKNFLDIPLEILQSLKIKFQLFHSAQEFCKHIQISETMSYILIFDYEDLTKKDMYFILDIVKDKYIHNFIAKILVYKNESIIDKVEYLEQGINYFLSKPINMLELFAYLSTIDQLISKIRMLMHQETQAKNIENITRLNEHLTEHVKIPIQRFMDFKLSKKLNERAIKEYLIVSRKSAVEVLAAINAVKEQLQEMMNYISSNEGVSHLSDIYEKNLLLTNAAYGVDNDK